MPLTYALLSASDSDSDSYDDTAGSKRHKGPPAPEPQTRAYRFVDTAALPPPSIVIDVSSEDDDQPADGAPGGAQHTLAISREDIARLEGSTWLNDNVVNFYLRMVQIRADERSIPAHIFSTYFYTKLEQSKGQHEAIARWTNNIDVFDKIFLFIPIHVNKSHWCCGVINMRDKLFEYYDPLHDDKKSPQTPFYRYIRAWLAGEARAKGRPGFEATELKRWKTNSISQPRQKNSVDCGVFVSQFVNYRCAQHPLTFSQSDMPALRRQMTHEIRKQQLQPLP